MAQWFLDRFSHSQAVWECRPERNQDLSSVVLIQKLKCFFLIDLKLGNLTHQDVGQMDTWIRLHDDLRTGEDDNPTIGLVLCSEQSEAVVKYSVLADQKQLFSAKYLPYLSSE
jgi:hypothetical protein